MWQCQFFLVVPDDRDPRRYCKWAPTHTRSKSSFASAPEQCMCFEGVCRPSPRKRERKEKKVSSERQSDSSPSSIVWTVPRQVTQMGHQKILPCTVVLIVRWPPVVGPNGGRLGGYDRFFGQRLRDESIAITFRWQIETNSISSTPITPWLCSRLIKQTRISVNFFGPATIVVLDRCRSSTNSCPRQPVRRTN